MLRKDVIAGEKNINNKERKTASLKTTFLIASYTEYTSESFADDVNFTIAILAEDGIIPTI